jgi:Ca-activated chloride channel family protein
VPQEPETLDPDQRVIILFDRSGSMRQELDGVPKIDLARGFFRDLGDQIVGRRNVSVRFFANGEDRDRAVACQAGVSALPFGRVATRGEIDAMVASVAATGQATNIDHALRAARSEMRAAGGGRILLISDGLETCEGDPAALAEMMGDMPIDVIAMGDGADLAPLADIALNSGGEFNLADSPAAFAAATSASLPDFAMPALPDTPAASADTLVQVLELETGVNSCPAFDVVQERIIEVTRGSVSLTSETVPLCHRTTTGRSRPSSFSTPAARWPDAPATR